MDLVGDLLFGYLDPSGFGGRRMCLHGVLGAVSGFQVLGATTCAPLVPEIISQDL